MSYPPKTSIFTDSWKSRIPAPPRAPRRFSPPAPGPAPGCTPGPRPRPRPRAAPGSSPARSGPPPGPPPLRQPQRREAPPPALGPQNRQIYRGYWGGSALKLQKRPPDPENRPPEVIFLAWGVDGGAAPDLTAPQTVLWAVSCTASPLPRRFGKTDTVPSLAPAHERPPPPPPVVRRTARAALTTWVSSL